MAQIRAERESENGNGDSVDTCCMGEYHWIRQNRFGWVQTESGDGVSTVPESSEE